MRNFLWLLLLAFAFSSCNINKDILFKAPADYDYATVPDTIDAAYKISPNDIVDFQFFVSKGYILTEGNINSKEGANLALRDKNQRLHYIVDRDGTVKFPILGRVHISGLTIREAENKLEELYSKYYNEPFVMLEINNNRIIVSPGGGGDAKVIPLTNQNTTLMEALALAGGVNDRGDASQIKLIRRTEDGQGHEVYKIDLSTIEGLAQADIVVQANDIIYVRPLPMLARETVREIAPYISLLSSIVLVISVLNLQK